MVDTDVQMVVSDDNAMDVPKRIRPRPLAKNSQNQGKVPNVADQRDMELNRIRKFLFFFLALVVCELPSNRSQQ